MPPQSEAQHAEISSAATNATIVAAVAGKRIRVLSFFLVAVTAVTVRFESTSGGAALTGLMSVGATDVLAPGYNPLGHFQTVAGQLLNLELGGTVQVSGALTYVLVD